MEEREGPNTKGKCPLCGEITPLAKPYCRHCSYRLPWADAIEGIKDTEQKSPSIENPILDRVLADWGLLPAHTVACRFCNAPIEVDAKQCPSCKEWLVSAEHEFEIDPWSPGYSDKDTERVNMLRPRSGCLTLVSFFMAVGQAWFWLIT